MEAVTPAVPDLAPVMAEKTMEITTTPAVAMTAITETMAAVMEMVVGAGLDLVTEPILVEDPTTTMQEDPQAELELKIRGKTDTSELLRKHFS